MNLNFICTKIEFEFAKNLGMIIKSQTSSIRLEWKYKTNNISSFPCSSLGFHLCPLQLLQLSMLWNLSSFHQIGLNNIPLEILSSVDNHRIKNYSKIWRETSGKAVRRQGVMTAVNRTLAKKDVWVISDEDPTVGSLIGRYR